MKLYRIYAVFLRHIILIPRDLHRLLDLLYWPLMDIILWGFMFLWVQTDSIASDISLILLTALVLWSLVYRANMEIAYSLLDELWSHNMVNLFCSPLTFNEWVVAVLALGFVKVGLVFLYSSTLVYVLFSMSIFSLGWILLPFILLLIVSGWSIGFCATAIISFFGQKMQTLAWVITPLFAPFCAVFYPVSSLPWWAQKIAALFPMTYIFEGMRTVITTGIIDTYDLGMGALLSAIYLIGAFGLLKYSFERSKVYGLARLERFE